MNKLLRWNTPFTETENPSVGIYIEYGSNEIELVTAVVAPHGIDAYPKYLVHFGESIEYNCYEEAYTPERSYDSTEANEKDLCAYEWQDSPNIKAYEKGLPFITSNPEGSLSHFILFGGDNIVEVITPNKPKIETINESITMNIEIKV